ncbi:MAG TPA: type VI secretion system contractile sheath small subunit [Fibrobacteria bacterium]|nr:type VI secretion system contractile sheath small subunit [Fibrobacteria bacterium]
MAGSSFQNEIPPARVNIQLSVDKGNAAKKTELPLKMLVLGDFTQRKDDTRIADREKININKTNFDQVMESLDLGVKTVVPNKIANDGTDMQVDLKIKNMKSFDPSEIVKQVPELSKLMAARNLIRDLGSNLLDNREFRKRMEGILKDKSAIDSILAELDKNAPEKKEG